MEGQVADSGRFPLLRAHFWRPQCACGQRWRCDAGHSSRHRVRHVSPGSVSPGSGAGFDREKYLADLRAKYGNGQPNTGAQRCR